MSSIKDFTLNYEVPNERDYFSAGDTVAGLVTLTLSKTTKVESLFVKMKGDANVYWVQSYKDIQKENRRHIRFFKLKESLLAESSQGTVLPKGVHHFKFRLRIPQDYFCKSWPSKSVFQDWYMNVPVVSRKDLPSSFKGEFGNIVYVLEAKMSRNWRMPSGVKQDLKFVSKSILHHDQETCTQSGSVDNEMMVLSKGQVQMSATLNRKVCSPGDTLSVVAQIRNSSTQKIKPKLSLHQKTVYHTYTSEKTCERTLCKMGGDTIAPNSEETAPCQLKIPDDVIYTLHNCDMISVEYYLKVYLDISFAFDPEVVFPLIIVPASSAAVHPDEAVGPHPAGAVGASSDSDFPPPAYPFGLYPAPTALGAYGYSAPDPTQQANTASGYDNQWPQQAPPDEYPTAAFPPSSVQHQAPTASFLFDQGEEPPTYSSLFFTPHDALGSTESDHNT